MRTVRLALAAAALAAATLPAHAQTEIQWWHSMTGGLNDWVVDLANGFNASQKDYKVVPTYKGSYDESMTAAIAAFRAGNAPHILQVFEVGTANMMASKGAIVPVSEKEEELLGGVRDTLRERQGQPPDEAWIRKILAPVMDALELMHSQNCFHRDVAPDNIMLLRDGRPVLLDFGAARRVISDMTQALTVILKPGYAPIEQYAEMPGVKQGPWTDIYALGAVVYFTITGRTPPPAVGRMMQDVYEPLAVVAAGRYSDQFLKGIDQCLRVKGEDRPQSIAQMRAVLGIDAGLASTHHTAAAPRTDEEQSFQTLAPSSIPATTHVSQIGAPPAAATPAAAAPIAKDAPGASEKKRSAVPLYAAGAAIAGVIAVGAFMFTRSPAPPPAVPEAPATEPVAPPPQAVAPAAPEPPPRILALGWAAS